MRRSTFYFNRMLTVGMLVLGTITVLPLYGDMVLYSTSFENPPFTVGPIAGQDGWNVFGPGISTIENTFAKTGTQAVFVDGSTASQSGPYHSDSTTGPLVDLSADIAIFTSSTQSEWQFAGLGSGLFPFLGGIDIFPNDNIEAITKGFPVIGTFPRATAFNASAWHNINLLFDIATQTYNITLDGVTLAANVPFCGDNGPCAGAPVSSYGTGFFDSFGQSSNPGANDSGYMDNFRVTAAAVPEPSSMIPLLIGFAAVCFWRRKA